MSLENCPNCGADLPRHARACPECGSDENTGWSADAPATGLDLPDENFDYEKFVEEEFGDKPKVVPRGMHPVWWVAAVLVLGALLFLWLL